MKQQKLKRAVVKEELIALTGDWMKAVILNQLIYWSERVSDFDAFIEEEKARNSDTSIALTSGWIYKSAKELSNEVMAVSEDNARTKMDELVKSGLVDRRTNPNYAWDRTYQYRVNIREIQVRLQKLGLALEKHPLIASAFSIPSHTECIPSQSESIPSQSGAIPETTSQTTTESPEKRLSAAPSSGGRGRSVPKTGYREEPERVAVGDENGNERNDARAQNGLERYILRQCQGNPQYLSPTNRRKLQEPIYVYKGKAQIEEPSPLLEWENDSEGFEEWVGKVANYVGGKGNRPTLAKLIQAIRNNYDAEGWGWLATRSNDLPVDDPSQPWNQ